MLKRKKILSMLLVLMVMLFTVTACSSKSGKGTVKNDTAQSKKIKGETKYPLTIKDSYNREVTIDNEPKRVISIAPNITETIFALEKGDKLIGRTEYCDYPEEVKNVK
jgi:iron complex transport system substrate-binding protein